MKNLKMSDAPYLEELEKILKEILPRHIIVIGCGDGFLLKHLSKIAGPKVIVSTDEKEMAIDDISGSVFLNAFSEKSRFSSWSTLKNSLGIIHLEVHQPNTLLEAGKLGWFPKAGRSLPFPKEEPRFSLNHFVYCPFTVRRPLLSDLPQLMRLENACWTEALAMPEEVIAGRIRNYPDGNLIVEHEGTLSGVVYSQLISSMDQIYKIQGRDADTLFDPEGSVIQILALNVLPEKRQHQLGGQLLEFFLQLSSFHPKITQIFGVTRCLTYPGADKISMESFIKEKNSEGYPVDYVLRTHFQHGADIRAVVPHYRPKDEVNLGFGVLVVYPKHDRKVISKGANSSPKQTFL